MTRRSRHRGRRGWSTLTQPHGGSCLGEPGENDYLVVRSGRGWFKLLAAEPGSIGVLDTAHAGYADVELRSLGLCVFTYQVDRDRLRQSRVARLPVYGPAVDRRRRRQNTRLHRWYSGALSERPCPQSYHPRAVRRSAGRFSGCLSN